MTYELFSGSGTLTRFILRRDRISILLWLSGIIGFTLFLVPIMDNLYSTNEELAVMAQTMLNPAMVALVGPVYGADNYTTGAMYANMMMLIMAIVVAVMNIFLVTRHTRQDEELGRMEVVRSLPVGRLSKLSAALLTSILVNAVLALAIGLGITAFGIDSMGLNGSMLLGAVMGVTGLFFAAATAIFCQLTANNRTATSFSFIFLMLLYLLRAAGDLKAEALSLISPLGLILRTEVYVGNNWRPIWIVLGISLLAAGLALYLAKIRDLGSGLLPARPGRARAGKLLSTPLGLAFRLLRSSIIIWAATMFVFAAMYGSIFGDLDTFIGSNEMLKAIFAQNTEFSFAEQFIVLLMAVMAMLGTVPVLSLMQRVRQEEKSGHTEQLLARAVSRTTLLTSYFIISLIVSVLLMYLTALGFWSAGSITMADAPSFGTFIEAAMAYLPAIWVMLGLTMVLIAYLPGKSSLIYLYLGFSFLSIYIGAIARLPEWVGKLSPFGHIPQIPVADMDAPKLIIITIIAASLFVFGFIGFRHRDVKMS